MDIEQVKHRDRWGCRFCGEKFAELTVFKYGNDDTNDSYMTTCYGCLNYLSSLPLADAYKVCSRLQRKNKIVLIGDIHGSFDVLNDVLEKESPFDFFLSVGDIGKLSDVTPQNISIIDRWKDSGNFIFGNHDDCLFFNQLELVQEINGIKIVSLNGMLKSRTFLKEQVNNISFREIMYLSRLKDVDILVTHQPPTGLFKGVGEYVLGDLLTYLVPKIYISGHLHRYKIRFYLQTFVMSLPLITRGYAVAYFQGKDLRNIEVILKKGKKIIRV